MKHTLEAFRDYLGFDIPDVDAEMTTGHTSKVCRTIGERIIHGQNAIKLHTTFSGELCSAFDGTSDKNDEFQAVGVTKKTDNVCFDDINICWLYRNSGCVNIFALLWFLTLDIVKYDSTRIFGTWCSYDTIENSS